MLKYFLSLFLLLFSVACMPETAEVSDTTPVSEEAKLADLLGVWDIALYYDPNQPPSATVMEISAVDIDNGVVTGTFYGSEFSSAQAVFHRGEVIFSAVTADGTGPYAHAGRLTGEGEFQGQTLSTGRDFVMAWEATRHMETE